MDNRITDELRALCGVSNGVKYNDFGEYSIMRGRVAEECDKIDSAFEELEKEKLDADIEYEQLKKVCAQIIGQEECEGLTSEEMADLATIELEKRLMPDGYEWLLEVWPKWSNGEYCKFGDWWTAERYGEYNPKQFRRLVIYTPEQLSEWGQGDGESYGYEWDFMRPSEVGYRPDKADPPSSQVLAADNEPLEVGQTVWHISNGIEFTVVSIFNLEEPPAVKLWLNDDGSFTTLDPDQLTHHRPVLDANGVPIKVGDTVYVIDTGSSAEVLKVNGHGCYLSFGSLCGTYDSDQLTHTKPEPPDSWERLEEDCAKSDVDYCAERGLLDPSCDTVEGDASTRHCTDCCCTCGEKMARDLVRRAKNLAGVE